jgi:hypothetical protein
VRSAARSRRTDSKWATGEPLTIELADGCGNVSGVFNLDESESLGISRQPVANYFHGRDVVPMVLKPAAEFDFA